MPALLIVLEVRHHDLADNLLTVGFRIGTIASTRRSRLRGIMSAELMSKTAALGEAIPRHGQSGKCVRAPGSDR